MTTPDRIPALTAALRTAITALWGADPSAGKNYGRIVSDRHFDRHTALRADADIVIGGQHDRTERYLAPTVVTFAHTGERPTGRARCVLLIRGCGLSPLRCSVGAACRPGPADAELDGPLPVLVFVFASGAVVTGHPLGGCSPVAA